MRRVVAPHTEDKTFSGAGNLVPPIVLMVEGWADEDNFAKLLKNNLAPQTLAQHGLTGSSTLGIYAHQLTILRIP